MGAQVVKINILLHFHSVPSALDSCIGGVNLVGSKMAAQAMDTTATISKISFIVVLPLSGACRLGLDRIFRTPSTSNSIKH